MPRQASRSRRGAEHGSSGDLGRAFAFHDRTSDTGPFDAESNMQLGSATERRFAAVRPLCEHNRSAGPMLPQAQAPDLYVESRGPLQETIEVGMEEILPSFCRVLLDEV